MIMAWSMARLILTSNQLIRKNFGAGREGFLPGWFSKGVAEKYYRPGINRVPLIINLTEKQV